MTLQAAIVLAVLASAVLLFLTGWLRADVVAVLATVSLVVFGVIKPEEALAGFGNPAVVAIAALLIVGAGLARTGVVRWIALRLGRLGGESRTRVALLSTVFPGLLAGFGSILAAASIFIPVVMRLARQARIDRARFLLPMAVSGLMGANLSLIGASHNLVVDSLLREAGQEGFHFFEFTIVGIFVLGAAVLYSLILGDRLLPGTVLYTDLHRLDPEDELVATYGVNDQLWEVWVKPKSGAVGQSFSEMGLRKTYGLSVMSIIGKQGLQLVERGDVPIQGGDVLILEGDEERVKRLCEDQDGLVLMGHAHAQERFSWSLCDLIEVVVPPRSAVIGRTLRDLNLRRRTGLTAVALWRDNRPWSTDVSNYALREGDALLLFGSKEKTHAFEPTPDLLWLHSPRKQEAPLALRRLGPAAAIVFLAIIVLASAGWLPISIAALAGAAAMIMLGILSPKQAYESVDWRTVVMVGGLYPIGAALEKSGAGSFLGNLLIATLGDFGPHAVLLGVAVLAMLLTQPMHNAVVAVILTPVALNTASILHSNPRAFAVAVLAGASASFLLPAGHPASLLVQEPGKYRTRDYVRFGSPLCVVILAIIMIVVPLVWPL